MSYHLLEEKEVKARKKHKCDCCLKPIEIGTIYHREKSIYEGFQDFKMHIVCREFFLEWLRKSGEVEFSFDELNEDWEASQEEVPE